MENKSFVFNLQLFAKTWTLGYNGGNLEFASGNTTASGSTLTEALGALGSDLGEGDTINLATNVSLGTSGTLDFKGATLNLTGNLTANTYYLNAGGGGGSAGKITIKNLTINNSTSTTANEGGDSIDVESGSAASLVLSGVTINETKGGSAIRTYDYAGTIELENSTINTTGEGASLFFDGDNSRATVTLDSTTTVTSAKTGKKQIIWLGGSSTMTSNATIVDNIAYSNTVM